MGESKQQKLRQSIVYSVVRIAENEGKSNDNNWKASAAAVHHLAHFLHAYTYTMARDMEAFCRHAGRKIITPEDVKLLARRNPGVVEDLTAYIQANCASNEHKGRKRRKTNAVEPTTARTTEGKRDEVDGLVPDGDGVI
eukprot:TRINITY_DN40395_c0_g1_i1.p1 TRINITY_DN40395_c0_g1~~TRINITY_DN40395_c0_g1_i1.p1  ORF type:complete len:157 (+),score=25.64 TRINITY_DN40395_c0_g1_i1:57-473(+)